MSSADLKPCPFCGGVAILDREEIFCDECYVSMKIRPRQDYGEAKNYRNARALAIENWNMREGKE